MSLKNCLGIRIVTICTASTLSPTEPEKHRKKFKNRPTGNTCRQMPDDRFRIEMIPRGFNNEIRRCLSTLASVKFNKRKIAWKLCPHQYFSKIFAAISIYRFTGGVKFTCERHTVKFKLDSSKSSTWNVVAFESWWIAGGNDIDRGTRLLDWT